MNFLDASYTLLAFFGFLGRQACLTLERLLSIYTYLTRLFIGYMQTKQNTVPSFGGIYARHVEVTRKTNEGTEIVWVKLFGLNCNQ